MEETETAGRKKLLHLPPTSDDDGLPGTKQLGIQASLENCFLILDNRTAFHI